MTDAGGTAELVGDNGIIIPKKDPAAISEAVIRLIKDRGMRKKMGERSREIALNFTWGKVAEKYMEIYESCVKNEACQ